MGRPQAGSNATLDFATAAIVALVPGINGFRDGDDSKAEGVIYEMNCDRIYFICGHIYAYLLEHRLLSVPLFRIQCISNFENEMIHELTAVASAKVET